MRTSEIDGLTWEHVDFERKEIPIRQALVNSMISEPKTLESNREIMMSPFVFEALRAQYQVSYGKSKFVFCSHTGEPLDYHNVNRRIWHPTLKNLGLKPRSAYQTTSSCLKFSVLIWLSPAWSVMAAWVVLVLCVGAIVP